MDVLSVVCARAGSKGLKNKCITKIGDKMLVEYSIEYSLSLADTVKTVVSTDIEILIDYCIKNNITCIRRNPMFCTDDSKMDDALAEAIEKEGEDCRYCSVVLGNIPVRYPSLFNDALSFLERNKDFDAVVSMQNVGKFHPDWTFDYKEDILPDKRGVKHRRQLLPPMMIHDGHTKLFRIDKFLKKYKNLIPCGDSVYSIFGDKIRPLINSKVIIDIDVEQDLQLAKAFILSKKGVLL